MLRSLVGSKGNAALLSDQGHGSLFLAPRDPLRGRFHQSCAVSFTPHPSGKHGLYELNVEGSDPGTVRSSLEDEGIKYRSIIPTKSGTKVVIFDSEGNMDPVVQALARNNGVGNN